jgi:hypothetical protein
MILGSLVAMNLKVASLEMYSVVEDWDGWKFLVPLPDLPPPTSFRVTLS